MSEYEVGGVVRLQLSKANENFRYCWDGQQGVRDRGCGGEWVDGCIVEIEESPIYLMVIDYCNIEGTDKTMALPLPGHYGWDSMKDLSGFPRPPRAALRKCCCGAGDDAPGHSDWCDRAIDKKAMGMA